MTLTVRFSCLGTTHLGPIAFVLWALLSISAVADEPLQYNRDVRPILAEYCFACHGPDSAARKADLRLDLRDAAIDHGAIAPGEPDESSLIERILSDDPAETMPPPETKKDLSAEQKKILKRWIAEKAAYEPHWSFIPPARAPLPTVSNPGWAKNAIDHFVLQKLDAAKLTPAPEADPKTLFRRLHLDITGLVPEPQDVAAFEADFRQQGDAALSAWIDRLMKQPQWGEHRARYWLDAARYSDTHGMHFDNYREIWPYRDWVIRSFNANQPFDQFIVEQLAGDMLPNPTDDQLIATGFQRCNITTNEGGTIEEENLALYATDRVQTFGWVFLGLTTNCCQCHDHKFDPLTMRDFYSLAAFFRNTTQSGLDGNSKDGRAATLIIPSVADMPRWKALPDEIAAAKQARDARRASARSDFDRWLETLTADQVSTRIPTAGLALNARLNEGNGNDVKAQVPATTSLRAKGDLKWDPSGRLGASPVFSNGHTIELGDVGDWELDQSFSYGAWVRVGNAGGSSAIIARMDESANYRGWDLFQNGGVFSVHLIDVWPSNTLKPITRGDAVKAGTWQHVFVTYDGSRKIEGIKIFIDGKEEKLRAEVNSLQPNASIRTKTPARVGQRSDRSVFENGSVQDVRIYERALTPAEVGELASASALASFLQTPAADRTEAQKNSMFEYYLTSVDAEFPQLSEKIGKLEREHADIRSRSPLTHIQEERKDSEAIAHILMRGEYDKKGEQVKAATPGALHAMAPDLPRNRLGLAKWVVDPNNALTARVTVNRFWQQMFGQGLVTSAEDFGVMGSVPTHPELLDDLAVNFRENGWDVQKLFKEIFMSATYRQAAVATPEKLEHDRDNHLYSRGPRFRMDAEMVRDLALRTSGLLSPKMYGPGVKPYQPENIWDVVGLPEGDTRNYVPDQGENLYRRTLYSFWKRMAHPPNMDILNAPSREVCVVRRERSNTPLQALVTLNDPLFFEAARNLAQSGLEKDANNERKLLDDFGARVLNRPFTEKEVELLLADQREYLAYYQSNPTDAQLLLAVGASPRDEKIPLTTLAAWTLVCNQILNLDEALNKVP